MTQEMAEVNVEELASKDVEHEVASVTVADTKHIRSYATPRQTFNIRTMHLFQLFICCLHGGY
jgi:hypothetical protein